MSKLFRFALEGERTDGKPQKEKEIVIYGKIRNFEDLKKAARYEDQEQYEIKVQKVEGNAVGGRIRIRKTTDENGTVQYVTTIKTDTSDGVPIEVPYEAPEAAFTQFMYMAEYGKLCRRYEFPIEGTKMKWEVDVFMDANNTMHQWVKIDLEYESETLESIPNFPFEMDDVITNQKGQRTPEEEATVKMLYDTVFKSANPILAKAE